MHVRNYIQRSKRHLELSVTSARLILRWDAIAREAAWLNSDCPRVPYFGANHESLFGRIAFAEASLTARGIGRRRSRGKQILEASA